MYTNQPTTKPREDESDLPQADILKATMAKLDESLKARDVQKLQFTLLNGLLKVRWRQGMACWAL